MPQEIYIDVSELEAPEPFERIMPLVRELKANQYIKIFHRKEPFPLYEILLENGYSYRVNSLGEGKYFIFIWISTDKNTSQYCHKMDFKQSFNT